MTELRRGHLDPTPTCFATAILPFVLDRLTPPEHPVTQL